MSKGNGQQLMEHSSFPLNFSYLTEKTSSKLHKDVWEQSLFLTETGAEERKRFLTIIFKDHTYKSPEIFIPLPRNPEKIENPAHGKSVANLLRNMQTVIMSNYKVIQIWYS